MIMSARRVLVGAGRPPQDHVIVTKQDQHEVAAGAMLGEHAWPGKLHGELCALIAPVFAQARSRFAAFAYVAALLATAGDRRSCWQLGEQAGHDTPRRMQAVAGGGVLPAGKRAGRPGPAPGPPLAVISPPHRAVPVPPRAAPPRDPPAPPHPRTLGTS